MTWPGCSNISGVVLDTYINHSYRLELFYTYYKTSLLQVSNENKFTPCFDGQLSKY